MGVPFVKTDSGISVHLKGHNVVIGSDNPVYNQVLAALKNKDVSEKDLNRLLDKTTAVTRFGRGKLTVDQNLGQISYNGRVVHNVVVQRIFDLMNAGLPSQPLVNFLEKLLQNPSMQSQEELFDFLAHCNLPITEDGDFLAYKGVCADYMDRYSRTINNAPGQTVRLDRSLVDDNRNAGCSKGLHAGEESYARSYCNEKIVVVKINPAHVVSVPHDCSYKKLRTSEYYVLKDCEGSLTAPVYTATGDVYDEQDDYDDYDEYDDDSYDDDGDDYFDEGDVDSVDSKGNSSVGNDNWKTQKRARNGRFA